MSVQCIIFLILLGSVSEACPVVCDCQSLSAGINVDCSSKALSSIPSNVPSGTVNLFLYNNAIEVVAEDAFSNMVDLKELFIYGNKITELRKRTFWNLPNLQVLQMSDNNISILDEELFRDNNNLRELHLQQNNITAIPNRIFENATALQVIYLYENQIQGIEPNTFSRLHLLRELYLQKNMLTALDANTFPGLPVLDIVDVSQNKISLVESYTFYNLTCLRTVYLYSNLLASLKSYTFRDLHSLERVDVYDNQISVIEPFTFHNVPSVAKVQLHFNTLVCNCSVQWFYAWLKSHPELGTAEATCASTGTYITDLTNEHFKDCDRYDINIPQALSCTMHNNVDIPCTLTGQQGTFVAWHHYRKGELVQTLPGKTGGNTNILSLSSCTAEDSGVYVCVWNLSTQPVQMVNGSTFLTVNVDLGLPKSSVCNTTENVHFFCNLTSTTLDPDGWIQLYNDVIIRTLPESVLSITSCVTQDTGLYRCRLNGDLYGLNISNYEVNLEIYGPPIIVSKNILTTGTSRQLSVLFLSVPPSTSIEWQFENKSLNGDTSYDISTTSTHTKLLQYGVEVERPTFQTKLTIHNFDSSIDGGDYYCVIGNDYGFANETFQINSGGQTTNDDNDIEVWLIAVIVVIVVFVIVLTTVLCCVCYCAKNKTDDGGNRISSSSIGHRQRAQEAEYDTINEYQMRTSSFLEETVVKTAHQPSIRDTENTHVKYVTEGPSDYLSPVSGLSSNSRESYGSQTEGSDGYLSVSNFSNPSANSRRSFNSTESTNGYDDSISIGYADFS